MASTTGRSYTNLIIGSFLLLIAVITFFPFYYVIVASFSDANLLREGHLLLLPQGFSLSAYKMIFSNQRFVNCFNVSVLRTVLGLIINLTLQCMVAYPLSRKYLPGRKYFTLYIIFAMLFNGGIIPTYLIVKQTGLLDTIFALVIPGAISTWNVIILRSFFENIPESLEESAKIDGANDVYIFIKIILPLSKPVIMTIGLFIAVHHWNAFMDAVIYVTSSKLQVLQLYLRDMVVYMEKASLLGDGTMSSDVSSISLRTATIFTSTLPIIIIYPFIQKHFIKGVMIGAIKG